MNVPSGPNSWVQFVARSDIDVADLVGRDIVRERKPAVAFALEAPLRDEDPGGRELLDAVVGGGFDDVDVSQRCRPRSRSGTDELAVLAPEPPQPRRKVPALENFWTRLLLVSAT